MSAFKNLNSTDFIISPLEVNKGFRFEGNSALTSSTVSIDRFLGNPTDSGSSTGYLLSISQSAIYNSIKQLYYSNYISGSDGNIQVALTQSKNPDGTYDGLTPSNAYYNFEPSNLDPKRYFPTGSDETIGVLSIPKKLFGDYIQPNSIFITTDSGSYFDDGEGRLKRQVGNNSIYVGNVIYEHGIIILTGGTRTEGLGETDGYESDEYEIDVYEGRLFDSNDILNFVTGSNITCSFSSSYTIYETQYKCTIGESEFNITQNPSIADENGNMLEFASQDYFSPYVTTVGLYNDRKDLLAVAKLGQPLATSQTTDTSILINIDRQ